MAIEHLIGDKCSVDSANHITVFIYIDIFSNNDKACCTCQAKDFHNVIALADVKHHKHNRLNM